MKILDRAARLEKTLLDKLARRNDIARHPLEIYRAVLDDIEEATEPGGRGGRIFPYTHVKVVVATHDAHHCATAEAVFAEPPSLETRVRARLRHAGCADVDGIQVNVEFVAAEGGRQERGYHIDFTRQPLKRTARAVRARAAEPRVVHLAVAAGVAVRSRYTLNDARINLGRLENVLDRQQRVVRHNHVAFADADDPVTQSVSRAHAHIRFDSASGEARLHDDGSTHGTRVTRRGRTLEVPRGERGLALRDGDEVLLGQARIRVNLRAR